MTSKHAIRAPVDNWAANRKYAVIIDAGSSGSRVQVYSWRDHAYAALYATQEEGASLPRVEKGDETGENWTMKINPGVSSFADHPKDIGEEHLKKLYEHALRVVPEEQVSETPVYLLATAGMRLLTTEEQHDILSEACLYTQKHTKFLLPECDSHFQVITGETEGLYGWISINYLLGGFDALMDGKHHTYGFLDMGGASAQIAFVPNKTEAAAHKEDLTLLRLRTLEGETKEWQVFVSTWLGFGANEARRRHLESIVHDHHSATSDLYYDPCMPKGLVEEFQSSSKKMLSTIEGTGDLNDCLTTLEPLLSKNAPCPDPPCLFAGVHVPNIDFDINHFIGISEYYYSTQDVFGLGGAYDYHTLSIAVEAYCSRDWSSILNDLKENKFPPQVQQSKLQEVCFKASWMMNVLHDGIGIPRVTKEFDTDLPAQHNGTEELREGAKEKGFDSAFNSAETLAGTEVSWTLGKMVLYSSSAVVSSSAEPVGFGPNTPDHTTFHIAGELDAAYRAGFPKRVSSHGYSALGFFILMSALIIYMLKGPRKASLLAGMASLWHVNHRKVIGARGDQSYERVMEEGDPEEERRFEMSHIPRNNSQARSAIFSNGLARSSSQLRLGRGSREGSSDEDDKMS